MNTSFTFRPFVVGFMLMNTVNGIAFAEEAEVIRGMLSHYQLDYGRCAGQCGPESMRLQKFLFDTYGLNTELRFAASGPHFYLTHEGLVIDPTIHQFLGNRSIFVGTFDELKALYAKNGYRAGSYISPARIYGDPLSSQVCRNTKGLSGGGLSSAAGKPRAFSVSPWATLGAFALSSALSDYADFSAAFKDDQLRRAMASAASQTDYLGRAKLYEQGWIPREMDGPRPPLFSVPDGVPRSPSIGEWLTRSAPQLEMKIFPDIYLPPRQIRQPLNAEERQMYGLIYPGDPGDPRPFFTKPGSPYYEQEVAIRKAGHQNYQPRFSSSYMNRCHDQGVDPSVSFCRPSDFYGFSFNR